MSKSRQDLRALIKSAGNPAPVAATIEGLGEVFLKVQTIATSEVNRKKLRTLQEEKGEDGLQTGRALALVICDAEGNYLYDIDSHEDLHELAALRPEVANAIFEAAGDANRLKKEDVEGNR